MVSRERPNRLGTSGWEPTTWLDLTERLPQVTELCRKGDLAVISRPRVLFAISSEKIGVREEVSSGWVSLVQSSPSVVTATTKEEAFWTRSVKQVATTTRIVSSYISEIGSDVEVNRSSSLREDGETGEAVLVSGVSSISADLVGPSQKVKDIKVNDQQKSTKKVYESK